MVLRTFADRDLPFPTRTLWREADGGSRGQAPMPARWTTNPADLRSIVLLHLSLLVDIGLRHPGGERQRCDAECRMQPTWTVLIVALIGTFHA